MGVGMRAGFGSGMSSRLSPKSKPRSAVEVGMIIDGMDRRCGAGKRIGKGRGCCGRSA